MGLALHNYHGAHNTFVSLRQGTGGSKYTGNNNSLSGFVLLLPFIEQQALYAQWTSTYTSPTTGRVYPPWGPEMSRCQTYTNDYGPTKSQPPTILCPSDSAGYPKTSGGCGGPLGDTNYVFCFGDSSMNQDNCYQNASFRGIFGAQTFVTIAQIIDGTSNTIAMSECVVGKNTWNERSIHGGHTWGGIPSIETAPFAGVCLNLKQGSMIGPGSPNAYGMRGNHYAAGWAVFTAFNTVLPPNSITCVLTAATYCRNSLLPPDSYHPGGVNGLLADGSVRFISETIDTGNLTTVSPYVTTGQSPFGVWGALGSRACGEPKSP